MKTNNSPWIEPNYNKLLIDDQPLQVLPNLAKLIGLNEAIVLQQIHYLLKISKNYRDGYKWVYNSFEQWVEIFPFWSMSTIKRIFKSLENSDLVISSSNQNKLKFDKTKWYRINYSKLNQLVSNLMNEEMQEYQAEIDEQSTKFDEPIDSVNLTLSEMSNWHEGTYQNDTHNNHKTTHKNTTQDLSPLPPQGGMGIFAQSNNHNPYFEELWEAYTNAPIELGNVARTSHKKQAQGIFEKLNLQPYTKQLVQIIQNFWNADTGWQNGFQPALSKFLSEKMYLEQPQNLDKYNSLGRAKLVKHKNYDQFSEED
ncbi:hypothetical protein A6A19_00405 [Actinobacillus delphinicola]|uniref:hypothetical protein n=1 Tax=Actinobacillus delphinicola TaxID=51161 RepID=UPI0024428138|nr:hypothetical protein [Actinobacillus delphinicola]MDG6896507.1 hypothetical protein [Actinobacillus delphinicola]